jgi:hypothetical protein
MYDIIFISYQETYADSNYKKLLVRFPTAKRVHGVKGIHQAHITAAKKCFTKMFWAVDADAQLTPDFSFNYEVSNWDLDTVHIWRSINPINDLVYGYGGVKLLPKKLTMNVDIHSTDMTTSISNNIKVIDQISNYSVFNTDEFSTWRSAFRECAKLASKIIQGQVDKETEQRLEAWCTVGVDRKYGKYAISGACAGREYGLANRDDRGALVLINDFDWLHEQFQQHTMG